MMGKLISEITDAPVKFPTRRLLPWLVACALLVVGSTFLPYLYAYLVTPSGMEFQGILVLPQDLYGYLAKMQLGARGEWLFRLTYTGEDHDGALLSILYLALGRLSNIAGLPLIVTFHLARLVTSVILLVTVFYAALTIFGKRNFAWASFAIAGLASGLGWLMTIFGYLSSDLLIPELTTYYSMFDNPHFPLGMAILTIVLVLMLKAVERQDARYALVAGLLTLAESLILPFLVITIFAVISIWLIWRWAEQRRLARRELVYFMLLVGLTIPGLINDYLALYMNPLLREWSAQNVTPSPPPYDFLLGYGLLAILAALGVAHLWHANGPLPLSVEARRLLLTWPMATILLLYVPFSLQRRLVAGLHIGLTLLAVAGFYGYVVPRLQRLRPRGVLTIFLVAMIPSNLFLLVFIMVGIGDHPYPLYLKDGEIAAFRWLGENSASGDTVLGSEETGNAVPGLAGNRVFYGHPFETVRANEKRALLARFFAGAMDEGEERSFLSEHGIVLLYYGRSERKLGRFDPSTRFYLERVLSNSDADIYRVK